MTSFNYDILNTTAHRPWPMPSSPWVMTQTWHDLLFAHWPVDADVLREKIPSGFELDEFEGQAWLGVVPFHMTNVSPRGVPNVPWMSAFAELNVRTYVRAGGDRLGLLLQPRRRESGRRRRRANDVHLPYFSANMQSTSVMGGSTTRAGDRPRRRSSSHDTAHEDARPPVRALWNIF